MPQVSVRQAAPRECARCRLPQEEKFRFCPECGLPTQAEPILSTQIDAARRAALSRRDTPSILDWRRLAVISSLLFMGLFVVALGLFLFNSTLVDRVIEPPPSGDVAPMFTRQEWEPAWVEIPAGDYILGPPSDPQQITRDQSFLISKYEVTNGLWHDFLRSEHAQLVTLGIWNDQAVPRCGEGGDGWEIDEEGFPRPLRDEEARPVRYVSPTAVAYFCEWITRRVGDAEWRIRPPTQEEWECAARGHNGQRYPWSDVYWSEAAGGVGGAEKRPAVGNIGNGQARPSHVYSGTDDVSPFGVVAMGSNVQELAIDLEPSGRSSIPDLIARGKIGFYRCGASFATPPEKGESVALAWKTDADLQGTVRFPYVGVRLVKVRVR